ncbi:MAG TPA: SRPBCC family protein [Bacillales bacterium]|nr:SRPBCC family protein [Bacillales bacterium]HEU5141234.1 SRPBCC family protein [Bacillales bacterium]
MNNLTKIKIAKPAHEVFEAFVDPEKIGNYWFSSSSERWEQGKTVTLRYDEYGAEGEIEVKEIQQDKKIVFIWGADHTVTISLEETGNSETIVGINEEGFQENDDELIDQLVDNKEGWVYMLTCLKGYLEYGAQLRAALLK